MPPRKSTPSSKAKGKRKATQPVEDDSPATRRRTRTTTSQPHPHPHHSGSDEDQDQSQGEEEEEEPTQFITATQSDAYLVYSNQPSKTSESLLSNSIDPAFSLESYRQALHDFDSLCESNEDGRLTSLKEIRQGSIERAREQFERWNWELEQGFNLLWMGLGSKRTLLNEFSERVARRKGNVVVVEGYDLNCNLGDVVTALEDIVRLHEEKEVETATMEQEGATNTPTKRKKTTKSSPRKKTKQSQEQVSSAPPPPSASTSSSYRSARPVSALENRVRKLCTSLSSMTKSFPPIYLLIHSLDSPPLRLSKHISLLALLSSQSKIHFIATVDHVRSSFLFPTSLTLSRPSITTDSSTPSTQRSFNFLHYTIQTLLPYTHETTSLSTPSQLFPPTIYPPFESLSNSNSSTSTALMESTLHVLASVTERSRRVWNLLARSQVAVGEMLEREVERKMNLGGGGGMRKEGEKSPVVASEIQSFKNLATDLLIATHPDQVDGLLSEFKDHGVVLTSNVAPEIIPGINDDDDDGDQDENAGGGGGGEWVWIPLERESLEMVLEELGIEE